MARGLDRLRPLRERYDELERGQTLVELGDRHPPFVDRSSVVRHRRALSRRHGLGSESGLAPRGCWHGHLGRCRAWRRLLGGALTEDREVDDGTDHSEDGGDDQNPQVQRS